MLLLLPVGIYFTFSLKFIQIRNLKHSLDIIRGKFDDPKDIGEISHWRALTTALSATVGTGNIAGVALAIYWGGPGAVFWMWVTGFLGMATKFVGCTLAHHYRVVHADGSISGGPMYYIERGLKQRFGLFAKVLAVLFSAGTVLVSFGLGNMAQSNSIADAMFTNYHLPHWLTGLTLTILVFMVIIGGIRRIAQITSKLVPIMGFLYGAGAVIIILLHLEFVLPALRMIVHDAFTGTAASGGFVGSTFLITARWGIARGIFSNEAGQGSAPIAHAAAKTKWAVREGAVAAVGPLIDTLIICTMTALVIIFTGSWDSGLKGVSMTMSAYNAGLAPIQLTMITKHIVPISLLLFAFSTTLGWSYYGDRAATYLFGQGSILPYRLVYCLFLFMGSIWSLDLVWNFSDMAITFMTIPNLIAVVLLFPTLKRLTHEYFERMRHELET